MRLSASVRWLLSLGFFLVLALGSWFGYRLFVSIYQGWLIESVPDSTVFVEDLQRQVAELDTLKHPALIHLVDSDCPCAFLTLSHAQSVSAKAEQNGYQVYQALSSYEGLGEVVSRINTPVNPIVVFTRPDGSIAYAGAYSDGLRCTEANSLVDQFIDYPDQLPTFAVAGLDVNVCRCSQ